MGNSRKKWTLVDRLVPLLPEDDTGLEGESPHNIIHKALLLMQAMNEGNFGHK